MNAWLNRWSCPLEDSPCGEDLSFEPEFEAIRDEVDKGASLHAAGPTDWEFVLESASELLGTRTKDLWLLCYGTRAMLTKNGLEGLAAALEVSVRETETRWDDIYPPARRPARRAAPFTWLAARLEPLLTTDCFPVAEQEVYRRLHENLTRLHALLEAKLGEAAPSFSSILRAVPLKEPEPEKVADLQPELLKQAPPTPAYAPPTTSDEGRVTDSVLPQLLRNTGEQCRQLGDHYLALNNTDWRGYLLHRAAVWATISQLPPADTEGTTQLRIVPKDKIREYQSAMSAKQYFAVLPALERSASKAPFWFDGHRMVADCLQALNATAALNTLELMLRELLSIFPELIVLKFMDGSPFASPETQTWLFGLSGGGEGTHSPPKSVLPALFEDQGEEKNRSPLTAALATAEIEGFEAGFSLLGPRPAAKSRGAVLYAVNAARYCLMRERPSAAIQLLRETYSRLVKWELLEWEPELSAQVIALILTAERSAKDGKIKGQDSEELLQQLHWLHMPSALQFGKA